MVVMDRGGRGGMSGELGLPVRLAVQKYVTND